MQARPKPGGNLVAAQRCRQIALHHHGAVGQVPGGLGHTVCQKLAAQDAKAAIGRHQHIATLLLVAGKLQPHERIVLLHTQHRFIQMQRNLGASAHGVHQQAVQVGPMHGGVGCTITLARRIAQAKRAQQFSRQGVADLQALRKSQHRIQRLLQTPPIQHAHGVGAKLNTRAHLRKLGRALKQGNPRPTASASQRR